MDFGTLAGAFGSGLTGLAQGAEAGISLQQKQQQIDLQKERGKLQAIQMLDNLDKWSPALRKMAGPSALKYMFKSIGIDDMASVQPMIDIFTKDDGGEQKSAMLGFIAKTLNENPGDIQAIFKNMNPGDMAKVGVQMNQMKRGADLDAFRRSGYSNTDLVYDEYGRVVGRRTTKGIIPVPGTSQPPATAAPTTTPAPETTAPTTTAPTLRPNTPLGALPAQTDDQKAAEVTGLLDTANRGPQIQPEGVPRSILAPKPTTIPLEMDRVPQTAEAVPTPGKPLGYRGDPTKTGPEYMATLPPGRADLIKQYGEYRKAPPEGNSANALQLKTDIARAYPDYDAKNWLQYKKAITDFSAGGQSGKNVVSLTTAIGHMGTMFDLYRALGSGSVPLANAVMNAAKRATGDTSITNLDAARQALADELKRVFTVVGVGTEADRKGWFDILSAAKTPEQANGVLRTMSKLLESRVGALQKEWTDQGPPGRPMPGYPTSEATAALEKIKASAPPTAEPLPTQSGKVDTGKLIPGRIYQNPNGVRRRWNGQQFEAAP